MFFTSSHTSPSHTFLRTRSKPRLYHYLGRIRKPDNSIAGDFLVLLRGTSIFIIFAVSTTWKASLTMISDIYFFISYHAFYVFSTTMRRNLGSTTASYLTTTSADQGMPRFPRCTMT
ncbi:hypothetical protein F4801DRAFT_315158 [Xylaria longipes]|nr:hypothetical protein F4801DRAFT_315158 [Xylaria longipes]